MPSTSELLSLLLPYPPVNIVNVGVGGVACEIVAVAANSAAAGAGIAVAVFW